MGIKLFNRPITCNVPVVNRGTPVEIGYNPSALGINNTYTARITDASSSLPAHLNLAEMESELTYTTSEGKSVNKITNDGRTDSNATNKRVQFTTYVTDNNATTQVSINKIRIGNRVYKCGFNLEPVKALELDLSSGFEKVAIPYRAVVDGCTPDAKGILTFKADDKEYLVNGAYDSSTQRMVYDFKSPADKLDITLIQVGALKSTAEMDHLAKRKSNLSPAATNLYPFASLDPLGLNMMGINGNVWTKRGCPSCGGKCTDYEGNLEAGDGKCPRGPCTYCGHSGLCPNCDGGVQEILWPLN